MSQRNREFMKLYQEHRYQHQVNYYTERSQEFKGAYVQVLTLTGVIMVLTTVVSLVIAAVTSSPWTPLLTILAVGLPALSTALAAYNELLAFERQSKLYEDTEKALHTASAESPDYKKGLSESDYDIAVGVYVNIIEGIFQKEQGQWGQLQSQAKMVELPAAKTTQLLEDDTAKEKAIGLPKKEAPPAEGAQQKENSDRVSSLDPEQEAQDKPEQP